MQAESRLSAKAAESRFDRQQEETRKKHEKKIAKERQAPLKRRAKPDEDLGEPSSKRTRPSRVREGRQDHADEDLGAEDEDGRVDANGELGEDGRGI